MDPNEAEARRRYPQYAWALDEPDLRAKLLQAVAEGWPPERLQGEIQGTNWWKANQPSLRNWENLFASDPAAAHAQHVAEYAKIQDLSRTMGLQLTHEQLHYFSLDALRFGWNDQQINDKLVSFIGSYPGGEARAAPGSFAQAEAAVRQLYKSYMIPDDGGQEGGIFNWAKQILAGEQTIEGLTELMRDSAIRLHPHLKDALDKGQTMEQIFQPYGAEIANILGLNPAQIDWQKDLRFKELIDYRDSQGNLRLPSLAEIDQKVKTDERFGYDYTFNARQESAQMTSAFLQKMGLA